jgi:uncharacterized protein YjbI with pentapeptide repeats
MSSQPNQPPGKRPTRAKRLWSAIKASSRWTEKRAIEPFANYLDQADIFRIVEKLSPVIEAIGIIAIPLVIWLATQSAQEAKDESEKAARAQEAVKNYLNQLSTVFLDGDLEKDERLRTVTRASTLALLNDPNLDGKHKGQVIDYLTELKLVQVEESDFKEEENSLKAKEAVISLSFSNLNGADLIRANLSGVNLKKADLSKAYIFWADLSRADLSEANLSETNLMGTKLSEANLRRAFLRKTKLSGADLSNADFSDAYLDETAIRGAKLCKTILPSEIKLDPNRDCKELGITP